MEYSILFANQSSNTGDVCIYQTSPNIDNPNVMSLAWLTKAAHPTTNVKFNWSIDYDFEWAETGELVPGVVFEASQVWAANLTNQNSVRLNYLQGAYTFDNLSQTGEEGKLYIEESSTIPLKEASVGIGMSGKGTFAVQAQPNLNLVFTPHPTYWITFGNFIQGEVLDITEISNSLQVDFPPNVYTMVATLGQDNTWSVAPLA
jgi:hypothetical protein